VICINLWRGKEHLFDWTIRQMTKTFNQDPLCVEHKHIENIIAFSSPQPLEASHVKGGLKRLVSLGDELELNVRGGLEFLLRQMMELTPESTSESQAELQADSQTEHDPSLNDQSEALNSSPRDKSTDAQPVEGDTAEQEVRVDPYEPSSPPSAVEPTS